MEDCRHGHELGFERVPAPAGHRHAHVVGVESGIGLAVKREQTLQILEIELEITIGERDRRRHRKLGSQEYGFAGGETGSQLRERFPDTVEVIVAGTAVIGGTGLPARHRHRALRGQALKYLQFLANNARIHGCSNSRAFFR